MPNDQFCHELLCFLAKYKDENDFPIPFICHASKNGWQKFGEWIIVRWFDYNFLMWCFKKAKFANGQEMVWTMYKVFSSKNLISTVEMGRKAGHKGNKLNQWAERLGFDLKHHDATSDTYCCLETYKYLKNENRMI